MNQRLAPQIEGRHCASVNPARDRAKVMLDAFIDHADIVRVPPFTGTADGTP